MWHNSTGIIQYDPVRPGLKSKRDWWCILKTDREITRYFRYWVDNNPVCFGETSLQLCEPSWNAHVSIIRGEKPRPDRMHLWKKYNGMQVDFRYKHEVRRSGDTTGWDRPDDYFFVEIDCPALLDIRREFGFPAHWKLHMTIGRLWNHD